MSTADSVIKGVEIAERIASAIAGAFALDRHEVLKVAKGALPELVEPAPDEAAAYFEARDAVLGTTKPSER